MLDNMTRGRLHRRVRARHRRRIPFDRASTRRNRTSASTKRTTSSCAPGPSPGRSPTRASTTTSTTSIRGRGPTRRRTRRSGFPRRGRAARSNGRRRCATPIARRLSPIAAVARFFQMYRDEAREGAATQASPDQLALVEPDLCRRDRREGDARGEAASRSARQSLPQDADRDAAAAGLYQHRIDEARPRRQGAPASPQTDRGSRRQPASSSSAAPTRCARSSPSTRTSPASTPRSPRPSSARCRTTWRAPTRRRSPRRFCPTSATACRKARDKPQRSRATCNGCVDRRGSV